MPKYDVSVEKRLYCTGIYPIEANCPEAGERKVYALIEAGKLRISDINWGEPQDEEMSFVTTGDVD